MSPAKTVRDHHSPTNQLLAAPPAEDLERLSPHLRSVPLELVSLLFLKLAAPRAFKVSFMNQL